MTNLIVPFSAKVFITILLSLIILIVLPSTIVKVTDYIKGDTKENLKVEIEIEKANRDKLEGVIENQKDTIVIIQEDLKLKKDIVVDLTKIKQDNKDKVIKLKKEKDIKIETVIIDSTKTQEQKDLEISTIQINTLWSSYHENNA